MFENSYFSVSGHVLIIILYVIATTICLIGSFFVWIVVLSRRQLRSPMNYLLLNLSLSDVISSVTVYPYLFIIDHNKASDSAITRSRLCMLTEGLTPFFIASAASLLTLCAISFNRFLAIKYPTQQSLRMSRKGVLVFSIFAWLVGISCMLPSMLSFKWNSHFNACLREWGSIHSLPYRLCIMLLGLVLPVTFLLLSYTAIYFKAREITPFDRGRNDAALWMRQSRIRKAERMLGFLIFVYILCWFPFILYWTLFSVSNYFPQNTQVGIDRGLRWLRVTVLFCTLNGALNPFIYSVGCSDLKVIMRTTARVLWRKVTCRASYPVQPLTRRTTLTYRSNVTTRKKLSTRNVPFTVNSIIDDVA
eukprot:gene3519-4020_t